MNKKIKNIGKVVIMLTLLTTVTVPHLALAETAGDKEYTLLAPLPCVGNIDPNTGKLTPGTGCNENSESIKEKADIKTYIQYIFNLAIMLSAVAAVVMIVWGGLEYMLSSIPSVKVDGKARIKNAIFGLILVLCSYLILKTVDPRLVTIPSTLVPQLKITAKPMINDYLTLLDAMTNQSDQNQKTVREDIEKKNAAISKREQLENELSDLLDDYESDPTDEEKVDAIEAKRIELTNALADEAYLGSIKAMDETINAITAKTTSGEVILKNNNADTFSAYMDRIETAYTKGMAALDQYGSPTDVGVKKQSLEDTYNYRKGELILIRELVLNKDKSSRQALMEEEAVLKTSVQPLVNKISASNPNKLTLQSQLNTRINNLEALLALPSYNSSPIMD